jgi:hypothetical protein
MSCDFQPASRSLGPASPPLRLFTCQDSVVASYEISRRPSPFRSAIYIMLFPQPLCFENNPSFIGGVERRGADSPEPPSPIPYPLSFHILAHSFALLKISTLLFSMASALFAKKKHTRGGVRVSLQEEGLLNTATASSRSLADPVAFPSWLMRRSMLDFSERGGKIRESIPFVVKAAL